MRLQSFTPLEELKHLCLEGKPDSAHIHEEETLALVSKLAFASSVQAQYEALHHKCPNWLEELIPRITHELERRFAE